MKVISSALCQALEGHDRIWDKELPRLLFRCLFTLSTSLARHRYRDLFGTEEHIERTMASLAQSGFPYPTSASSVEIVSELFEDGIRSCPEGTAIQFECSRRVSYQDLGGMVDFMVSKLHGAVRFGQLVPVILPRSIQQICVILAIFKLGAVYVPLDAETPDTRLCSMVSFVGGGLVVTENESKRRFRGVTDVKLEYFNPFDFLREPLQQRASLPVPATNTVHPSDLAAILFTSGSTGRPKGRYALTPKSDRARATTLANGEYQSHVSNTSICAVRVRCPFNRHLMCCVQWCRALPSIE